MILDVSHKTVYRYSSPVVQSQHVIHLAPRMAANQSVRNHRLIVEPAPAVRYDGTDAFGNQHIVLDIEVPHTELSLNARSTVETTSTAPGDLDTSTPWDALDGRFTEADGSLNLDVIQYRCASRLAVPTHEVAAYAALSFAPGRPVLSAAMDLTLRMRKDFVFDATATEISTPISQVLRQRRGVCQDFAHLSLACLRAHRVPARYVSGYILTHPPPGQPKLQGSDASHAWISVWSPEHGWVEFDPTNGLLVRDEHVRVAFGRDYDDVSPISGVLLGGGEHTVAVSVDVNPIG